MAGHDEFRSEQPATAEEKLYKTGEHVTEDGAYACSNCGDWKHPPMVNLTKGQMTPVCTQCGPQSRWVKI